MARVSASTPWPAEGGGEPAPTLDMVSSIAELILQR